MGEDRIKLEIELDDGRVVAGFAKVETQGKKTAKKIKKSFAGKKIFGGAIKSLTSFKSILLGAGAALGAALGTRQLIAAANKQEDAIAGLNAALKRSGEFSKETSDDLQNFASQMQKTTTVGDETTLELLALAQAFGFTAEQSKVAAEAAIELSAAAGISLEESVRRVGRTISGSTADVSKFASGINNLTKEELAAGGAAQLLVDSLGGAAAAKLNTFGGATDAMSNAFGDVSEELGFMITRSPQVIAIIQSMTVFFKELGTKIEEFVETGQFNRLILDIVQVAKVMTLVLGGTVEVIANAFKAMGTRIGGIFAAISLAASGEFRNAAAAVIESSKDASEQMFDFSGTEAAERFFVSTEEFLANAKPVAEDAGNQLKEATKKPIAEITFASVAEDMRDNANKMQVTGKGLAKSLNKTIGGGAANAFVAFGDALATGQNALLAFGRVVLGVFADILIQLGTQTLAAGIAMSAVPVLFGLQGGAAIAAGAGMLIAGGVLKGLAGGGGAGAGAGGGASAPPTGAGGVVATSLDEPEADISVLGSQTGVTVNIQGNVLDRRQTGLEIAEVISEAFGDQGVFLVGSEA